MRKTVTKRNGDVVKFDFDKIINAIQKANNETGELEQYKPKLILPESLDYFNTPLYEAKLEDYKHNGNYKYKIAI